MCEHLYLCVRTVNLHVLLPRIDMKCNFDLYWFGGLVGSGLSSQAEGYLNQPDEELGLFIFYRFKCVS